MKKYPCCFTSGSLYNYNLGDDDDDDNDYDDDGDDDEVVPLLVDFWQSK